MVGRTAASRSSNTDLIANVREPSAEFSRK
jgi:hypothetical protein